MYGRDLHLDVENWNFDFNVLHNIGANLYYDEIEFESRYENVISVKFRNKGEDVYIADIDVFS